MKRVVSAIVGGLWIAAAPLRAQVVTTPKPVGQIVRTVCGLAELNTLNEFYNAGDWMKLQESGRRMVASVRDGISCDAPPPRASNATPPKVSEVKVPKANESELQRALDVTLNYVALTWIGSDSFGKNLVRRVIIHDPLPELFSANVPGLHDASGAGLFELYFSRTKEGKITSAYASTQEADPVVEGLSGFLQSIAGPLFGSLSGIQGEEAAPVGPPTLFATVKRVAFPFKRASITLVAKAKDPYFDADDFKKGLAGLKAGVLFDDASTSACGRALADDATKVLGGDPPPACNADLKICKATFDERLLKAFQDAHAACSNSHPDDAELGGLQNVDKRFREYVNGALTNPAELEQTFHNRPPTKIAFGAGTAYIPDANLSKPRVKLNDDGIVVADPLSRVATIAYVNWSPGGYNPDAAEISGGERLRMMFGSVLTPDFGIVAGANILLARGIGIGVGGMLLIAKGADGAQIGAAPADGKDPFDVSWVVAPFIGITYNYK